MRQGTQGLFIDHFINTKALAGLVDESMRWRLGKRNTIVNYFFWYLTWLYLRVEWCDVFKTSASLYYIESSTFNLWLKTSLK